VQHYLRPLITYAVTAAFASALTVALLAPWELVVAHFVKYQLVISGLVYGLAGYQPPRFFLETMIFPAIGHHSEATSFDRKFSAS